MILERRDFLKLLGSAAGATALGSCGRYLVPDQLVEAALRGPGIESHVNTICGMCEGGCGMTVRLVDGLPVGVKGNPRNPINRGGLCPVGQSALEVLYAPNRLQSPLRRQAEGGFQLLSWEEALEEISTHLRGLRASGVGRRIALLSGEQGQLFYDLAELFGQALGSASVGRRQQAAALPYQLSQGGDRVPGFDLAGADVVLSLGLDLFEDGPTPLHAIAALIGAREGRTRANLLYVGSRRSPTATKAAERLPVRPGTHAAAALGIAHVLVREGRYDSRFVADHTFGFEDWTDDEGSRRMGFRRLLLERYYPDRAAGLCGCEPGQIVRLARRLARADSPLVVCGGEASWSRSGIQTAVAAHALNALLGSFDRPGGVVLAPPIPFTDLDPQPRRAAEEGIFDTPAPDGPLGVDPIEALIVTAAADEGLEALILVETNPVYDSPSGDRLREALRKVPLVVAITPFLDETASEADFVLPAGLFLESWRDSTTPPGVAFSFMGVGTPVVDPLFDSRHPGDVLLELARRCGDPVAPTLPWASYEAYLSARLEGLLTSGQGAVISGSFEESWVHFLEERGWRFLEHGDRKRFWEDLTRAGGWWNPVRTPHDWQRLLPTETGRYEFFSLELEKRLRELGRAGDPPPAGAVEALQRGAETLGFSVSGDEACLPHFEPPPAHAADELALVPFRPITGRGNLGAASPMLLEMYGHTVLSGWETWVELAPETAHDLHVEEGDVVALESSRGEIEVVVRVEPGTMPGVALVPLGLGRSVGAYRGEIGANPLTIAPLVRDPLSGTPATAGFPVRLRRVRHRPRGGPRPLDGGHG